MDRRKDEVHGWYEGKVKGRQIAVCLGRSRWNPAHFRNVFFVGAGHSYFWAIHYSVLQYFVGRAPKHEHDTLSEISPVPLPHQREFHFHLDQGAPTHASAVRFLGKR
jgi:hypothetical protein